MKKKIDDNKNVFLIKELSFFFLVFHHFLTLGIFGCLKREHF